jgi:transposase
MVALRQANEVRSRRAELKRELREGVVLLEEVLAAPADYLATAEVFDLLMAAPKIGPVRAARLLAAAGASQSKPVGRLSERQRRRLIELLSR